MKFTAKQLEIIEQALEIAYETQLRTFEENSNRADRCALQLAVRSHRDVKRFSELLAEIRRDDSSASA